jgi:hypothetical protein
MPCDTAAILEHLPCFVQVDQGYLSHPETIAFPTTGGKTAYMNHYPPANKDFQLPGEAP